MFGAGSTLVFVVLSVAQSVRLEYRVREGLTQCPDAQWVRSAVAARLGREPFADDAKVVIRASIDAAQGSGLKALVEVERADRTIGRRTLESPQGDCLELASSVELAIALAIEPRWPAKRVEPPLPSTPQALPPEPLIPPLVVVVEPTPHAPPPPEVRGRIGLLGTAGGVPGVTGGFVVGGGVAWTRFGLFLEGRAHLPSGVVFGGGRAETFSALASALPCLWAGRWSGCGVVSVGAFQVESSIAGVPRATTVVAQAGARVSASFSLTPRLSFLPWLEAAVVLIRTSLVSGPSTIWVTWPVALSGGLTLELNLSS